MQNIARPNFADIQRRIDSHCQLHPADDANGVFLIAVLWTQVYYELTNRLFNVAKIELLAINQIYVTYHGRRFLASVYRHIDSDDTVDVDIGYLDSTQYQISDPTIIDKIVDNIISMLDQSWSSDVASALGDKIDHELLSK